MTLGPYIAWFFGGAFLFNAVPHVVAGMMGETFQSPFASPPGEGRSSSTVNVAWGFVNLALAWLLLRTGGFDIAAPACALASGLGALAIALFLARRFGRFNGGHAPLAGEE